ncbi:hypothetical protein SAMN05216266_105133 [Amycolatopsis marina]|uniref:Mce-associated membrane protein n=1 Tax=Amycolatopsis marina TaxID=490629 RepID=A0A1I0YLX1_9PSEU|nr:hypothetical protein [Amycolatopsis marina]SFB13460.1 hypothetical protein SAMN05216266_105133 [Amycolatopsis marina]
MALPDADAADTSEASADPGDSPNDGGDAESEPTTKRPSPHPRVEPAAAGESDRSEEEPQPEESSNEDEVRREPLRTRSTALLLLIACTLAAAGIVGWLWSGERAATARESASRDAVAAATDAALALTGLSYQHHEQDLARLREVTTGEFRQQLDAQADAFAETLATHQVESEGTVVAAGVEERDAEQATVVVIAEATVDNTESETGDRRQYRMRLGMTHEDGRWLVHGLEFLS